MPINTDKVKQIVAVKLTDNNFEVISQDEMDLLIYEVTADINMVDPPSQYTIENTPLFYEGIYMIGLYCKCLNRQSIEEKKRYVRVSDGAQVIDPPDLGAFFQALSAKCNEYMSLITKLKRYDSQVSRGLRLRPAIVMDRPFGSMFDIYRGGRNQLFTQMELFWKRL